MILISVIDKTTKSIREYQYTGTNPFEVMVDVILYERKIMAVWDAVIRQECRNMIKDFGTHLLAEVNGKDLYINLR